MSISRRIYFNEAEHKYTDSLGNQYISVTTILGNYHEHFNAKYHARRLAAENGGKGLGRYAGKTERQILDMWEKEKNAACHKGSTKHNFLESAIKSSSNFVIEKFADYSIGRLYTIADILHNHNFGRIELDFFVNTGIADRYPLIYRIIENYSNQGYKIYAEIGVFNADFLISGLIDVLLVKGTEFIVLDWKTNKDPMPHYKDENGYSIFLPGYFKKDREGNRVEWIQRPKYLYKPLHRLYDINGIKYTLQLSMYAYMVEMFGFKCKDLILCHIQDHVDDTYTKLSDQEMIEIHRIKYDPDSIAKVFEDRAIELQKIRQTQTQMNLWN